MNPLSMISGLVGNLFGGGNSNTQPQQASSVAPQEPQASVTQKLADGREITVSGREQFVKDYPIPGNTSSAGALSGNLDQASNTGTSSDNTQTLVVPRNAKVTIG
jgi:hypothetical protein